MNQIALVLRETIDRLRAAGFQGVAIIDQGGVVKSHYLAMAVGRDGRTCDPRNWETHDTPESALANLCEKLLVMDPRHQPTVGEALRHPREFVDGMTEN